MRLAAFALVLAAASAHGQTVYRCGSEYSQKPCADAKTVATDTSAPTAAEARKAQDQAKRNAKLADQMEKERVAQEKKVAGPQVVVTGQKPAAPAASQAKKSKKKEPDFKAVAPAPKKPKP